MTREEYLKKLLNIQHNPAKKEQTARPEKYPQGYFKKKQCKRCGKLFTPKAPSECYCSDFCKDYVTVEKYFIKNYNLTIEQYLDQAERQEFKCSLCGRENYPMKQGHSGCLVVDHNHETGVIRGLLCHDCNRALGLMHDDIAVLSKAISYLERVTTIPKGSTLK